MRTMLLLLCNIRSISFAADPETHRLYTPEQEADGKPVARMAVYDAVTKP